MQLYQVLALMIISFLAGCTFTTIGLYTDFKNKIKSKNNKIIILKNTVDKQNAK